MTGSTKHHYASLDGLRGLAALLILLFHSRFSCFTTFWIGVPVFFVLSGFLITRILIENKNSENYFKAFYYRRSLRIFPIYYFALFVSVIWGLLVHADFTHFPAFLLYLQNFQISQNDLPYYCNGLMNYTWSLSVEELFYLCWPLLVFISPGTLLLRAIFVTGMACILFKTVMLSFFYTEQTDQLLLLSLAGNLDGLMAGSLLGVLSLNKNSFVSSFRKKAFLPTFLSFCFLLAANYFVKGQFNFSLVKQLLSVITVVLTFFVIAWCISNEESSSLLSRIFKFKPLQQIGKISYGLYVYHALVYGITEACVYHFKINLEPITFLIIKIALTFFISLLSWRFIEQPLLQLKDKTSFKKADD